MEYDRDVPFCGRRSCPCPPPCPFNCCQGPTGPTGPAGTTIRGSYNTLRELLRDHPTGQPGDAYLVGGELYVWNTEERQWQPTGNLQGPTGPAWEPSQPLFSLAGNAGEPCAMGFEETLRLDSDTLDISVEPGPVVRIESPDTYKGALIPFASGTLQSVDTATDSGLMNNAAILGFGSSAVVNASTGSIALETARYAFPVPSDATLTEMSAHLSATSGGLLEQACVVSAQVFQSVNETTNLFEPLPGAVVTLEPIIGDAVGVLRYGVSPDMNVPVIAGRRLLMVFYLESEYKATTIAVTGFLSASLKMK